MWQYLLLIFDSLGKHNSDLFLIIFLTVWFLLMITKTIKILECNFLPTSVEK